MATVHIRRYVSTREWVKGPVWAIKTPYDLDFIEALKSEIHGRSREWVRPARVWIVSESYKQWLKDLLIEHFGAHEICTACAKGEPCWVWRAVDTEAAEAGLKGVSCGTTDAPRGGARARAEQPREKQQPPPRANDPFRDWWEQNQRQQRAREQREQHRPPPRASNVLTLHEAAELLGVPTTASLADVKKAFARAALAHHPDRGGDHAKMVQVNRAKEAFEAHFARAGARV